SIALIASSLIIGGSTEAKGTDEMIYTAPDAIAIIINEKGKEIGAAELRQTKKGVQITLQATNLRPGLHAFHVHEKGVCQPPDFKTSGDHFNPFGTKHGFDNPA